MKSYRSLLKGTLAAAFATMLLCGAASAQNAARVTVPFDFSANHRVLPAGCYQVKLESQGILTLKNCDSGKQVILMVFSTDAHQAVAQSSLVFYAGSRGYRLTDVRFTYTNVQSRLAVQPKPQRELAEKATDKTVEIAMR